ncbi:MAG: ECF-type sigma factor, partial [Planctomycetota bacterium]
MSNDESQRPSGGDSSGLTDLLLQSKSNDMLVDGERVKRRRAESRKGTVANSLFVALYDDFHRLAAGLLRRETPRDKLTTSSLVHEAYLRLVDQTRVDWKGRTHFFAVGARVMRRVLTDHARRVNANKRGGSWTRVPLENDVTFEMSRPEDVLALDELLQQLEKLNQRQADIVEQRFFAGMKMAEIAEELGCSLRTVETHWAIARAWLRRKMSDQ